jgi:hypothetical protein
MDALSPTASSPRAKAGRRRLTAPVAQDHAFGFVPDELRSQCHRLIVTFHEMHGYSCLPDLLWKAGLASFIERHAALNNALQKASTARSARRANEFFVIIAVEILALEVLARDYASWSGISPAAREKALELLGDGTPASRTWLIEHYLYPPRYDTPAARMSLPTPASVKVGGKDMSARDMSEKGLPEAVALDAAAAIIAELHPLE